MIEAKGYSIPIPFAIGQQAWWIGNSSQDEWIECPECCGTKVVTLTLGNGEEHSLKCECCSPGYDPARGVITNTIHKRTPIPFVCRRVTDFRLDEVMYSESSPDATCYSSVSSKDLFASRDDCEARCREANTESQKYQEEQRLSSRLSNRRKQAWSVHWWTRERDRLRKDLIRVEAHLGVCKERKAKREKTA